MKKRLSPRLIRSAFVAAALVSVAAIGTSVFVVVGRASAGSAPTPDPFKGIAAAEAGPTVAIDATGLRELPAAEVEQASFSGGLLLDEARALPSTVDSQPTYVIPTRSGQICLFVEHLVAGCTQLTPSAPVLFGASDQDGVGGNGPIVFGLAIDGVDSVSFTEQGQSHMVPVRNNVFEFDGASSASDDSYSNPTANFTDGHKVAIP